MRAGEGGQPAWHELFPTICVAARWRRWWKAACRGAARCGEALRDRAVDGDQAGRCVAADRELAARAARRRPALAARRGACGGAPRADRGDAGHDARERIVVGRSRKLNALRRSVGNDVGERAFSESLESQTATVPADRNAGRAADAPWPPIEQGSLKNSRGGYIVRRGRGRIVVETVESWTGLRSVGSCLAASPRAIGESVSSNGADNPGGSEESEPVPDPLISGGPAAASPYSRPARRSLAFRLACSLSHPLAALCLQSASGYVVVSADRLSCDRPKRQGLAGMTRLSTAH